MRAPRSLTLTHLNAGIAIHGCVRAPMPDAEGVHKFASRGTAVVVF